MGPAPDTLKAGSIACPCSAQKKNPGEGEDAGAQEQAIADGRSVSGRPCEWNSSAAPFRSLACSFGEEV